MNDSRSPLMPKARTEQLIIKELPDETLVYDLVSDQAHCLNSAAALVWKNCDGRKSIAEIGSVFSHEFGTAVDLRVVWLALDQLQKFDLLEIVATKPHHLPEINRRQLVRTMGTAALALPIVITIATQTAHAQASPCSGSSRPDGCPCTGNSQCIPSHKCTGGVCVP